MKQKRNYFLLVIKGVAMGAADVIPGVSGGTIAFITGIYEELLQSIKSIDGKALKLLFTLKFKQFWKKINANFLFSVLGGIAIAIFTLAKLMTFLLVNFPIEVWSFFFGLIIASSILVSKDISKWDYKSIISMLLGIVIAYFITALSPSNTPNDWWFIIISGAIAICAMILPGISGSFILLIMGKYYYIMDAVSKFDIKIMSLFAIGAISGIITFSHVLTWLLKRFHDMTIALLTGFMLGSLNKVWPWKEVMSTFVDRHGETKALQEANVLPQTYAEINSQDPHILYAVIFCILGFFLIVAIEYIAKIVSKTRK